MQTLQDELELLERERKDMLLNMKNDIDTNDSIEASYNQHLLNLKDMEFIRKEKQAQFHIRQKEMYIDHLKNQLALRDKIIKEKLGQSITSFLKQDVLTLKDMENASHEILLPSIGNSASKGSLVNESYDFNNSVSDETDYQNSSLYRHRKIKRHAPSNSPYPLPKIKADRSLLDHLSIKKKTTKYKRNDLLKGTFM